MEIYAVGDLSNITTPYLKLKESENPDLNLLNQIEKTKHQIKTIIERYNGTIEEKNEKNWKVKFSDPLDAVRSMIICQELVSRMNVYLTVDQYVYVPVHLSISDENVTNMVKRIKVSLTDSDMKNNNTYQRIERRIDELFNQMGDFHHIEQKYKKPEVPLAKIVEKIDKINITRLRKYALIIISVVTLLIGLLKIL